MLRNHDKFIEASPLALREQLTSQGTSACASAGGTLQHSDAGVCAPHPTHQQAKDCRIVMCVLRSVLLSSCMSGPAAHAGASHSQLLKLRMEGGLEGIELGPLLGRGSYGRVFKGAAPRTPPHISICKARMIFNSSQGAGTSLCGWRASGRDTSSASNAPPPPASAPGGPPHHLSGS